MQLWELCTAFTPDLANLPTLQDLSRALPLAVKVHAKKERGHLHAHCDESPRMTPSRQGVSLRDYEPGDPLKTIDTRAFLKTGSCLTRLQEAQATHEVRLLLHSHQAMAYGSGGVVKWQLAQALAALIALWHLESGHKVVVRIVEGANPLQNLDRIFSHAPFLTHYFLTDFLFRKELSANTLQPENETPEIFGEWVQSRRAQGIKLVVVRDIHEGFRTSKAINAAADDLHPFFEAGTRFFPYEQQASDGHPKLTWSGPSYLHRLRSQWQAWLQHAAYRPSALFTTNTPLQNVWQWLLTEVAEP